MMNDEDSSRKYLDLLGKEYEKAKGKKENKSFFKLKNVEDITDWRTVRPNLTKDFVDNNSDFSITANNLPYSNQENQIISDLFVCFLGGNGYYIQAVPLTHKHSLRSFKIDESVDEKLRDLTKQCLQLASYYSVICRFVEDNQLLNAGRVNQALVTAIDLTLQDYTSLVVQLQKIHLRQNLLLQTLWFHIQDVLSTFEVIMNIAMDISNKDLRGAATLSYLMEQCAHHAQLTDKKDLLKYLIKQASIPYMLSVKEWIFNGIIFDPFEEFMIVEKPKSTIKDCPIIEYWEKRYQIRKLNVPTFLEPYSNEILKSGLFLNVIKENIITHGKTLKLAPIGELKYSEKSEKYVNVIKRAYIHSSSHLLRHMIDEYHLLNRFIFMKKYFLFQQGDFIIHMLDMCKEELSKVIFDVIPSRLETLVDMAIGRGVESSIRNDVSIVLEPQDLWYQVSMIHSVQEQKKAGLNPNLTGFESFTLSMHCQWPLSLVFNAQTISYYQMLFRLLFYCKHIEQLLFKVWTIDRSLRKNPLKKLNQYFVVFSLRQKMIYFIQNMQYYMMEEAIEPNWIEFQQKLKQLTAMSTSDVSQVQTDFNQVYSLDDLLLVHKKFLDKCSNDCLLSNAVLFPIFMSLLSICKKFVMLIFDNEELLSNMLIKDGDEFFNEVNEIEEQFHDQFGHFLWSIAEYVPSDFGASKILEMLNRANFNHYFDSIIKQSRSQNEIK